MTDMSKRTEIFDGVLRSECGCRIMEETEPVPDHPTEKYPFAGPQHAGFYVTTAVTIEYCPLHASAQDLLDVIKGFVQQSNQSEELARELINKAEGRTSAP